MRFDLRENVDVYTNRINSNNPKRSTSDPVLKFLTSFFLYKYIFLCAATAEHAGEYKVVAKNEGGEAVSCADLRVVQPLPDVGMSAQHDRANPVSN